MKNILSPNRKKVFFVLLLLFFFSINFFYFILKKTLFSSPKSVQLQDIKNLKFQLEAIKNFTFIGEKENEIKSSLPILLQCLYHHDETIREEALSILSLIGPLAKEAVPHLISLLKNTRNYLKKKDFVRALASIGTEAKESIPEIINYFHYSKNEYKEYSLDAIFALGQISTGTKIAIPIILQALLDSHEFIIHKYRKSLSHMKNDINLDLVTAIQIRDYASQALADINIREDSIILALLKIIEEDISVGAFEAAITLSKLAPEEEKTIPVLLNIFNFRDAEFQQYQAATALVRLDYPDKNSFIPILIKTLEEPLDLIPVEFTLEAIIALGQIGSQAKIAIPSLQKMLHHKNKNIHQAAEESLKKIIRK